MFGDVEDGGGEDGGFRGVVGGWGWRVLGGVVGAGGGEAGEVGAKCADHCGELYENLRREDSFREECGG